MANLLYANNAVGTLAAGITNVSTTLTLNVGQAALFPAPGAGQSFYATLTDAATQTLIEIILVTAVAGNIFSITRGQNGTTALSWNANDILSQRTVAAELTGFENAAEGLFGSTGQNVAITPSTTLGIKGTTAADNVNAGGVGEYQTTSGFGVITPTNTPVNATSFLLTPGDWDVYGTASFSSAGSITLLNLTAGISTGSVTFGEYPNGAINAGQLLLASGSIQVPHSLVAPMTRVNISSNALVYLVAQAGYTGTGTMSSTGTMYARRVR